MEYRADINGLRAVAVLAVVFDHLEIWPFRGGFLGVDVFFVISGYLISGMVFSEIAAKKFSISGFYERRVRRILPALMAMLIVTIPLACVYFLPNETRGFAWSLLAAMLAISNIYFWTQSGYFDALGAEKPLLHTWSLGVEEQFYIFFPMFLMLGFQYFRNKLSFFVVALFLLSLIAYLLGAAYHPTMTFYMTPTRAWELLLGALVSLNVFPEIRAKLPRNAASFSGAVLIIASFIGFSGSTPYMSVAVILACAGAALIIAAGRNGNSIIGMALSARPIVFIGLISYSLYLWHWPIIVFHRMGFAPTGGLSQNLEKAGIILVSIIIATLSWKYIETPFRTRRISFKMLSTSAYSSASVLVLVSIILLATNGLERRFPPEVVEILSFLDYNKKEFDRDLGHTCFIDSSASYVDFDIDECLRLDSTKKNYLLIGDSHADALWYGLAKTRPDVNVMQVTASGCKPTIRHRADSKERCTKLIDYAFKEYIRNYKVDAILIGANWSERDLAFLPETLDYAKSHAKSVVLLGPIVKYNLALPKLLAISLLKNDHAYPYNNRSLKSEPLDKQMAQIAREKNVKYISFFDMLCEPDGCKTTVGKNIPILWDYGHLTWQGAVYAANRMNDLESNP